MKRNELNELHYISAIVNVESICTHGIFSHNRARALKHQSVAMKEIQERREQKMVPGGNPLHDYVNIYICARNPMMYKLKDNHVNLCVLRVNPAVLDLSGVVITDSNASSDYAIFKPMPDGLEMVDKELVFATNWIYDDQIQTYRHRSVKCAEVLVPDKIEPCFLAGIYASNDQTMNTLKVIPAVTRRRLEVSSNPSLFFQ